MDIEIRPFNLLETHMLYEILKLRCDVFIVEQSCPYADCDGKDNEAYHLAVTENGELAAYCRILNKNVSFDTVAIGRFVVQPKFRGLGLANKMLESAIDFIKSKLGESHIKLSAQEYLVNFYGSFGFKPISESYDEDGISHVDMELK
ncbi:GNAT family N-acetyltransferase [Tyzzerella sp. OttesenSCG-928-J15]|nr:GNAT family N-acetyltransferase [Tyzzerella sp. OttesenSCG-928-J15]